MARRVDQASNAAPAWLTAIRPYHIFRCVGVSTGRRRTAKKGCAVERSGAGSTSGFTLGSGAEGKTPGTAVSLVALSETAAERTCRSAFALDVAATFAASSRCGMAHSKSSVARTIYHLSLASGLASHAPLAVEPLYWPKVQLTLVL